MADIIITWPASRYLGDYLRECEKAQKTKKSINFKVSSHPKNVQVGDRCYVVHTGFIRCWHEIIGLAYRAEKQVIDPITKEYWPAGNYIVRNPETHLLSGSLHPMTGFQGYRYYDREEKS